MADGAHSVPPGERREEVAALDQAAGELVLDLGCGNGLFLAGLAQMHPAWQVVGVEKKEYRVRQTRRRIAGLVNASVIHGEVVEVLRAIADASVLRIYLLFNDPWPKRRHAVRRLVQREFSALLKTKLREGGRLFFATDSAEYYLWSKEVWLHAGWYVDGWEVGPEWLRTEFETRFVERGLMVYRLQATPP